MPEPAPLATFAELVRRAGKLAPSVAVEPESRLVEDLGIDSLDLVSLYLAVQDEFEVEVDDAAIPRLKRVGDVLAYIERERRNGAAAA